MEIDIFSIQYWIFIFVFVILYESSKYITKKILGGFK